MIVRDEKGAFYELYPVADKETENYSVELFRLLVTSLQCDEILNERFWDRYSIRAGEDGELHVYTKADGLIYDECGSLWLALVDIGREIIPNWENRI